MEDAGIVIQYKYKKMHSYLNNPYGFELPKPKLVIHPIIKKWDDFTEKDKIILQNIKRIIVSYIGECKVFVFGSRVNGKWDENSDYDIMVLKTSSKEIMETIRQYNYNILVDILFTEAKELTEENSIEII